MPIIPRRPFWGIDNFFEDNEWPVWPHLGRKLIMPELDMKTPRMDIYEEKDNVVAEIELPGIESKDIEVSVSDNILRVEAKKEEKKEEKDKGYFRKELRKGYFKRVVPLPVEVINEKAEAVYEGGILKVSVPKKKPQKLETQENGKKIKIKVKTA